MKQKIIVITDKQFNSLKNINASELIRMLLEQHFKFNTENISEIEDQIKRLKKIKKESKKDIEKEITKLQGIRSKVVVKTKEVEKIEKEKKEDMEKLKKQFFKNVVDITGKKANDKLFNKFIEEYKENKFNLFVFLKDNA